MYCDSHTEHHVWQSLEFLNLTAGAARGTYNLNHLLQLTTSYTSYLLYLQIMDTLLKFLSAICISTYHSAILDAMLNSIAKQYIKLRQVFFYLPRLNSMSKLKQLFPESQSNVIVPVYWPATRRNLFLNLLTSIF